MKTGKYFVTIATALFAFTSVSIAANPTKSKATLEKPSFEMMTSRMTEMQKEMDQINNTKDPKEKEVLLEKHMTNMQTQIDMMGQMMKDRTMMNGGMGQGKMMGQMHGMMNQMMGQMQGHMNSCPRSK